MMRDPKTLAKAILDIELLLAEYLEPGERDAAKTLMAIVERLDRDDVIAAAERIDDDFGGLRLVK